jgi:tetratricopeptide (TPR) repeat protein
MRLDRGDTGGATDAFQAGTKKRPDWPEAQMNLAIAYWNIGDHDGAGKAFEAVLAATPGSVDALKGLAALAVEREKYDQALDYQGQLIEKGERTPELFYNTGLLLQNSGQLEDAARLYREALEERPGFAEALLNLGHVLKSQGRQEEARDCWKQALDKKPELAQGYFSKAN